MVGRMSWKEWFIVAVLAAVVVLMVWAPTRKIRRVFADQDPDPSHDGERGTDWGELRERAARRARSQRRGRRRR